MAKKKRMSKKDDVLLVVLLLLIAAFGVYLISFKSHKNDDKQPSVDLEKTTREREVQRQGGWDGVSWEAYLYDPKLEICTQSIAQNSTLPDKLPKLSDCERENNVQANKLDAVQTCKQFSDKNYPHFQNDCFFNFALAKRDDRLCQSIIENDYLKEKCIKDVVTVK